MKTVLFAALAAGTAVAAQSSDVKAIAAKMVNAQPSEGKKLVIELENSGEAGIRQLVSMLKESNDADTVSASFALEALTMYLSRPGAERECRKFASTLGTMLETACADDVSRAVVVKLLQLCGGDAEVRVLAKQLSNARVRDYAIMALTQIGTPSARNALLETAKASETAVAMEYVSAFAKLREAEAGELLMTLWGAVKPYQRVAVMNALAEIGHEAAGEGMLAALKAESLVERTSAQGSLSKLVPAMKNREKALELARRFHEAAQTETSLTTLMDCQGVEATLDMLMQEVTSGDLVRREAVLRLLSKVEGEAVSARLVAVSETAAPIVRAAILAALGRRADASTRPFVVASMKHNEAVVRAAAYRALPYFGVVEAVPELVAALANAKKEDIYFLKEALGWQQCDGFNDHVASAVAGANGEGKIALIDLLARRRAQDKSAVVFDALASQDKNIRRACLKALEVLARPADIDRVLSFIVTCESVSERRLAQAVLVTLGRADSSVVRSFVQLLGTSASGVRVTLLQSMARIGGNEALQGVMSQLNHPEASVKDAAVRALSDWPDFGAAAALTELASQKENQIHRVLALRGLIRVSALPAGKTPDERVANLLKANALCLSNDERRLVLGAVGNIRTDYALENLVIPAFDTPELVAEASASAIKIICPADQKDKGMTTAAAHRALQLVLSKCGNEAMLAKARAQLNAFPPGGVDVAFGKPVKTSCPQQGNKAPTFAVDGITARESAWHGSEWPAWISVDLEQEETIDSIRPIFYWDGKRIYTYTIEVSTDAVNWKKVVDNSKNQTVSTPEGINHVLAPAVKARYVRLNILKNSVNEAVHLVELEVYSRTGKQPKATGANVLLRQPVTAGSKQEQHYSPDRVNDGRIGKFDGWHTDQCPTWIKVDMQQLIDIDTARVIFFWDGSRTYSYNIEVSEDDKTWKKVADNSNNQTPVDAQGIVHKFPAVKARYVRLNVTRGQSRYVHVVELEAYAAGKAPAVFPAAEKPVPKAVPLPKADEDGFINLFNGKDFTGWIGGTSGYGIKDGGIMYCDPKKGGKILTQWQFADFELHFDFLLSEGANNGLGIRTPTTGDPAYVGMELQIIDNDGYKKRGRLQPWQHHGSIYGVVPAKDGALKPAGQWNHQVVIARGSHIRVILNGETIVDADVSKIEKTADGKGRAKHPGLDRMTGHIGFLGHGALVEFKNVRIKVLEPYTEGPQNVPPEGFTALFNGKDLVGWKGLVGNPKTRAKMTDLQLAEAQAVADTVMRAHWTVKDGVLCFDGKGSALCTAKDYGNFELLVDWKMTKRGDSGIYLRGAPQVQIWDPEQWRIGSGGLYNNRKNPSRPTMIMDNPIGQWNRFRIRMIGERVSVWLNGALVVDNVVMENYWDRKIPIYPTGQIELQNHNSPLWFKNIFIKELD